MKLFCSLFFLIVFMCLINQSDERIRISRRKLRLLKKIAIVLLLGKNKKIYTVPFPLPLPLPIINKVQPIIYRQRVPYPVEVPVPVPYAEPVPYPVEVPLDDHPIDEYHDEYPEEDEVMETQGHASSHGQTHPNHYHHQNANRRRSRKYQDK